MRLVVLSSFRARLASISLIAVVSASPALADPPKITNVPTVITVPETNVLNLLSPFLSLDPNGTTLQTNLGDAIAINNVATSAQKAMAISDKALPGNLSFATPTRRMEAFRSPSVLPASLRAGCRFKPRSRQAELSPTNQSADTERRSVRHF